MEGRGRGRGQARGQRAPKSERQPQQQPQKQQRPGSESQQQRTQSEPVQQSQRAAQAQPAQQQKSQAPQQRNPQPLQVSHRGGMAGDNQITDGVKRMNVSGGSCDRYEQKVTRPAHITNDIKQGDVGTPVKVLTNYYQLETKPDFVLYQYHVSYNPEVEHKAVRKGMLYDHAELLGPTKAFDGMILYLPRKLQKQSVDVYSKDKKDGRNIQINIKLTRELPIDSPQCIQLLNIIFRRMLEYLGLKIIGRNYFDTNNTIPIQPHGLEVMPGYTTSILLYDGGVMLCVDTNHKVLRSDTVIDMIYKLHEKDKRSFMDEATRQLVGQIVLTRHNNKTYLIDDIAWKKRVTDTFPGRDGPITYIDYFKKQYNIDIHDLEQPMLVSLPKAKDVKQGKKSDIFLPPSLCVMTGIDEATRRNFTVMRDVHVHARQPPADRVKTLEQLVKKLKSNQEAVGELGRWNIQLAPKLKEVTARVLPIEAVYMDGRQLRYEQNKAEWSQSMKNVRPNTPIHLINWLIVVPNRCKNSANTLVDTLISVAKSMGITINPPVWIEINNDRTETYLSSLRGKIVNEETQLVMVMFPNQRKDRYEAIKKLTCCEVPVPCQLVLARTIERNARSVAMKIAIQINCKLGGDIWNVDIPLKSGVMVIGIDTFHKRGSKSVAATVASLNPTCTRFYSKASFQQERQELGSGLELNIHASLHAYQKVNKALPQWIIIYRDGVGDGDLNAVYDSEVPQILRTIKQVGGAEYNPNMYFIVVKKRINTRIMTVVGNQPINPTPGTVVDTIVTKPEWYDFFLVPQSARQGTVSPTHFNVLYSTPGLKANHMQRFAYKMTHLYYNWPGTVRVPAPCQYAHKLAALVGDALRCEPHPTLCDKLFFL